MLHLACARQPAHVPEEGARAADATGVAQRSPRRAAAGRPRRPTTARVRGHRSAASWQSRSPRPSHRHRVSGAAPSGARRPDPQRLGNRVRPPTPRLPADQLRQASPVRPACRLAPVLHRRHRTADEATVASHHLTAGHAGSTSAVERYLTELAAQLLPGPRTARIRVLTEIRARLTQTLDSHLAAALP